MNLSIIIEHKRGSYKDFNIEADPAWKNYPLKEITFPTDYGYIGGYAGEDGADLDVFVGTGDKHGYIKVERRDVPFETKFFTRVTDAELKKIIKAFHPVLLEHKELSESLFLEELKNFEI